MEDTLSKNVQKLISNISPEKQGDQISLLRRILKYSDDDRTLAYCLGLFLNSNLGTFHGMDGHVSDITNYIKSNNLEFYYSLKEKPKVEVASHTAFLIALLGLLLFTLPFLSLLKDYNNSEPFSRTIARFPTPLTIFIFIGFFLVFASIWKIVHNRRRTSLMNKLENLSNCH